jgi:hypothetical protein
MKWFAQKDVTIFKEFFSFGRRMGSLVCLVSGPYGDEQIFGTLGLASIC